jgi:predicted HD superfamily hydrolase involved in NAD metabolism
MEFDKLREAMKAVLKPSRYLHTIGVEEVSCDLAAINRCDMDKAAIAGILHDCAKAMTIDEMLDLCRMYNVQVSDIEARNESLLHSRAGALLARHKYGIEDQDIMDAIKYHTTGRPGMSVLEKIVFVADYIEPYRRKLPDIDKIREAAYEDLDRAVVMVAGNTLSYLKESGREIDKTTEETYDYYKNLISHERG